MESEEYKYCYCPFCDFKITQLEIKLSRLKYYTCPRCKKFDFTESITIEEYVKIAKYELECFMDKWKSQSKDPNEKFSKQKWKEKEIAIRFEYDPELL